MNFSHKTLSIDPGSVKIGITCISIIETKIHIIKTLQHTLIGYSKEERFQNLYQITEENIKENPDINDIVVESTFFAPQGKESRFSIDAPAALCMARGVIYAVAGKYKKKVFEYDNKQHKKILTGDGNATKSQIIRVVNLKLNKKVQEDEAMSVSLGFCHCIEKYNEHKKQLKQNHD